jgi:hypothetical protein
VSQLAAVPSSACDTTMAGLIVCGRHQSSSTGRASATRRVIPNRARPRRPCYERLPAGSIDREAVADGSRGSRFADPRERETREMPTPDGVADGPLSDSRTIDRT